MDCGIPFANLKKAACHNLIPEWNDLVFRDQWRDALDRCIRRITSSNLPAACLRHAGQVLGITDPAVTIKNIEMAIIDRGFAEGWVTPNMPSAQ